MAKPFPKIPGFDFPWIRRLNAAVCGVVGCGLACILYLIFPTWVTISWVLVDIFLASTRTDMTMLDWNYSRREQWAMRVFWAGWTFFTCCFGSWSWRGRLLVNHWLCRYIIGICGDEVLRYLDTDGPADKEWRLLTMCRDVMISYAFATHVTLYHHFYQGIATALWTRLAIILVPSVWVLGNALGYGERVRLLAWTLYQMPLAVLTVVQEVYAILESSYLHGIQEQILQSSRKEQSMLRLITPLFQYRPLMQGEIRLLVLEETGMSSMNTVRARILHCQLDTAPEYEALSYCWGSSDRSDNILLDGRLFPVTKSALELLLARRRRRRRSNLQAERIV